MAPGEPPRLLHRVCTALGTLDLLEPIGQAFSWSTHPGANQPSFYSSCPVPTGPKPRCSVSGTVPTLPLAQGACSPSLSPQIGGSPVHAWRRSKAPTERSPGAWEGVARGCLIQGPGARDSDSVRFVCAPVLTPDAAAAIPGRGQRHGRDQRGFSERPWMPGVFRALNRDYLGQLTSLVSPGVHMSH